jgi:hypothetical protein
MRMEELQECGQRLLDVALEYHALANKNGITGAVIWLTGSDGEMVIVTRGEYRETLMRNIEYRGPARHFGYSVDEVPA